MPRNSADRKIVRLAKEQLAAIREAINPELLNANIRVLMEIRDNSKDPRARNTAVKELHALMDRQLERDIPSKQIIDHNLDGEVVTEVVRRVVHVNKAEKKELESPKSE